MTKILASLPDKKHFRQTQNKGDRYQWVDLASDRLRVVSADPSPWGKPLVIVVGIDNGKRRNGAVYPKTLTLLCFDPTGQEYNFEGAIIRERWGGNFAHSNVPTEQFFALPATSDGDRDSWLMLSIIKK